MYLLVFSLLNDIQFRVCLKAEISCLLSRHWLKSGFFVFAESLALCVGAKPNVPLVRLAKIVFIKCAVEKKIKIQKRWLLGRLSDGSFVQSHVYVLFCHSFLLCLSLGLVVTGWVLPKAGHFSTTIDLKN
jgi:hypothetical protein